MSQFIFLSLGIQVVFNLSVSQVVFNLSLSQISNVVINMHKSLTTFMIISSGKIPRNVIPEAKGRNILKALDKYYIAKFLDRQVILIYSHTSIIFRRS